MTLEGQVKLWTLNSDLDMSEYFDKVGVGAAETYASLKLKLEEEEILDWTFEFWDIKDNRRIRRKVERLNNIKTDVYIYPNRTLILNPWGDADYMMDCTPLYVDCRLKSLSC